MPHEVKGHMRDGHYVRPHERRGGSTPEQNEWQERLGKKPNKAPKRGAQYGRQRKPPNKAAVAAGSTVVAAAALWAVTGISLAWIGLGLGLGIGVPLVRMARKNAKKRKAAKKKAWRAKKRAFKAKVSPRRRVKKALRAKKRAAVKGVNTRLESRWKSRQAPEPAAAPVMAAPAKRSGNGGPAGASAADLTHEPSTPAASTPSGSEQRAEAARTRSETARQAAQDDTARRFHGASDESGKPIGDVRTWLADQRRATR
jgi:hypothetical protein